MAARPDAAPAWIRSLYLYLVCLAAALVMLFGLIQVVVGLVNTVVPRTDMTPITQIANAVVDAVEDAAPRLGDTPPDFQQGIDAFRGAIDRQARNRGVARIVTGLVILAAGFVAHMLAWNRANREREGDLGRASAPAPVPPPGGYGPPPGYAPPGGYGGPAPPPYPG